MILYWQDDRVREAGRVIRAGVFYEPEYRELCLQQLSSFNPDRMTKGVFLVFFVNIDFWRVLHVPSIIIIIKALLFYRKPFLQNNTIKYYISILIRLSYSWISCI